MKSTETENTQLSLFQRARGYFLMLLSGKDSAVLHSKFDYAIFLVLLKSETFSNPWNELDLKSRRLDREDGTE